MSDDRDAVATTLTVSSVGWPMAWGEYISFSGPHGFRLSSITAKPTDTTITVRAAHTSRLLEWLHAAAEDYILWPLRLLKARYRVRVR